MTALRNEYIKNLIKVNEGEKSKEDIVTQQHEISTKFEEEIAKLREKEQEEDKGDDDDGEPDVKYAFVVFRDMCGMKLV